MSVFRNRWLKVALGLAVGLASFASAAPGAAPSPAAAQRNARAAQIDALFKDWDSAASPGASVAVIDKGKLVFSKGYGIANLEYGIPIKPDTIFHVASVSKQFTAMAVMLLQSDGKLSLDDDIRKYLPELPDYGKKISIRNLLQHTSGVRDQWQTLALAGWDMQDLITQDQILRMMFRQKELNFPPGSRHLYSNGGFTLAAEIVARVSGEKFPQFCKERIFVPLQMTHTHFHQDLTQIVHDRAYSYRKQDNGYAIAPLNYANVGATSLFTTPEDLVKWLDNFRTHTVGGAAALAEMQERGVLTDGSKIDYGLGLSIGNYRGLPIISHGGADAGYRSEVLWFPGKDIGVAVTSNLGAFNPDRLAKQVAEIYLADQMTPAEKKPAESAAYEADPKELEKYVGAYVLPKLDLDMRMAVEKGKLWVVGVGDEHLELRPLGPGHFSLKELGVDVTFTPKANDGMSIKITQGSDVNEGDRLAPADAAIVADLSSYAGTYWSEELETQYTFFVRDGKLFGLNSHHGEFELTPTLRDHFSSGQWFASRIRFVRDAKGKVVTAVMGGGRVSGVTFAVRTEPGHRSASDARVGNLRQWFPRCA